MGQTLWSEERVQELKRLWAEGYSAGAIAEIFGDKTRNAVIGKVHRINLAGRRTSITTDGARRPPRIRTKQTAKRVKRVAIPKSTPSPRPPLPTAPDSVVRLYEFRLKNPQVTFGNLVEPDSLKLNTLDLTDRTCKWPHGDPAKPDFNYCGKKIDFGTIYCEYHALLSMSEKTRVKMGFKA